MQFSFKQMLISVSKFLLYAVIFVSLTWSLLTVIIIIKNSNSEAKDVNSSQIIQNNDLLLPRFSSITDILNETERLSLLMEAYAEYGLASAYEQDQIINAAIILNLVDSTVAFQVLTARQCSCPSEVKNRFEVTNRIINPENFAEYMETEIQDLTAEDLSLINHQLILERRIESDQH